MTFLAGFGAAELLILIAAMVLLWRGIRQKRLRSLLLAPELVVLAAAGYLAMLRSLTTM